MVRKIYQNYDNIREKDYYKIVETFLKIPTLDVNSSEKNGGFPLINICKFTDEKLLELILKHKNLDVD